ncbi:MAG: hypothetical protein M1833_006543 [Piccolia ochrophora]|nr:MAG: hypothetical protein M1833_006543 [Piccolia ochrophora]
MPSNRPALYALKTPKSASFPSELPRSPLPGTPVYIKPEPGVKTPITPPTAYTDFLKALSSPSGLSPSTKSGKCSPTSNPSSDSSGCSCSCEHRHSPKFTVPPSPYAYPQSAPATGALRRLRIPQSPLNSPNGDSPRSAHSTRSPFSMRSPREWELERKARPSDASHMGASRPVSVKQIVTRTVTYTPRMDLAPAPKGKKRRLDC